MAMRHLTELALNGEYTKGQDDLFPMPMGALPSPDERGPPGRNDGVVVYSSFEAQAQKRMYT